MGVLGERWATSQEPKTSAHHCPNHKTRAYRWWSVAMPAVRDTTHETSFGAKTGRGYGPVECD